MAPPLSRTTTVFSKQPVPGEVKTRLCPPLAAEEAAELALAMLDDTVARHLAATSYAVELAVAPASALGWFRERYGARVPVSAQRGKGLGERLARWFDARCSAGSSVVVVGSDAPGLSSAVVKEAHERLAAGSDVVFAPDGGGGYSLVGLTRPAPWLFTEVAMSTDTMFPETVALARSRGLSVELLAEVPDVDTPADLDRLDREMESFTIDGSSLDPPFPPRTFEWLQRHSPRR